MATSNNGGSTAVDLLLLAVAAILLAGALAPRKEEQLALPLPAHDRNREPDSQAAA
jgi:hypothetical protein